MHPILEKVMAEIELIPYEAVSPVGTTDRDFFQGVGHQTAILQCIEAIRLVDARLDREEPDIRQALVNLLRGISDIAMLWTDNQKMLEPLVEDAMKALKGAKQ
jgi:hypothetical protein